MRHTPNVNKERHATPHDGVKRVSVVALSGVVREDDPIAALTDGRNPLRIRRIRREMGGVALNTVARFVEGVWNALSQIAVGEKSELMLRIRTPVIPLIRPLRAHSLS